jgi:PilZ domain
MFRFSNLQQFFKVRSGRKAPQDQFKPEKRIVPAAKKRDVRRSLQRAAWVTLEGGFATRQCVVHDMSATGAKLSVSDSSVLSGRMRLAFSRDAKTGRPCQVVWRRGHSFGVKFVR